MGDIFDRIAPDEEEGDVFDRVAPPKTPAANSRERLTARGIRPQANGRYAPVDADAARSKVHWIDSAHEVARSGPGPGAYLGAAAKGLVGLIPQISGDDSVLPGGTEAMNIARRLAVPQVEFDENPWRRRIMTAAGAVPYLGEPLQGLMKPSMIAPERMPTDQERLSAVESSVALGTLAAGKARGAGPGGGDWSAADPTLGARQRLSTKVAPRIGTNLLQPKNSQLQFGADPGEFVTGMKTKAGEGISSYGPQIDAKLKTLNAQADQVAFNTTEGRIAPINYEAALRKSFGQHIAEAVRDGNESMAKRLQGVLAQEIAALHKVTGGSGAAPARVGRRYQQDLGQQVGRFQKAGRAGVADPTDGTIRSARQDAWVEIKNQTNRAVPGLRDLNEQIHSGIEAKKALIDRELTELRADPVSLLSHPVAAALHAVPGAVGSPWFRSRLAAAARGMAPVDGPVMPETLPNEAMPWRAGVMPPTDRTLRLPAAAQQRALPPAPDAPQGFVSSDDMRRVGTRLGQMPSQDAAVFAPKGVTVNAVQAVADRHFNGDYALAEKYLRSKGAL